MPLIKIKAPTSWDTIPAGAAAVLDVLALSRIEDYFTGDTLDATNFGSVLSGGGTAQQEDPGLHLETPVTAAAAIGYVKKVISKTVSNKYVSRTRSKRNGGAGYPLFIQQSASAPVAGTTTALASKRVIEVAISSVGSINILYWDSSNVVHYWNGTGWQLAVFNFAGYADLDLFETQFETTADSWRIVFKDITTGTTIATTDYVTWAATRSTGADPLWHCTCDPFTNIYTFETVQVLFHENYSTSVVTVKGSEAVGTEILDVPITENVEAGASISWRYDIGAGWVTGGTGSLADLKTALIGTSPATLDLEATFTSDGDAAASFDINGGVIGSTGTACDYPTEANVLKDVVYDNGNLKGTLEKYSVETDPNDPKRQRIVDVLDTRLKTILTSKGYKTNLGNNVFRWRDMDANPFDPDTELPGINYADSDHDPIQTSHGPESVEHGLMIEMVLMANTEDEIRLARADISVAMGADIRFSDLAQDLSLEVDASNVAHDGDKIWSTKMTYIIIYTTGRFDPYE